MPLTKQEAQQELFTDHYRVWETASPAQSMSNGPQNCSIISVDTANLLKRQWNPSSKSNTWSESASKAYITKDGVKRWVTRSVSGGGTVVDFHALWNGYRFLWHFKTV